MISPKTKGDRYKQDIFNSQVRSEVDVLSLGSLNYFKRQNFSGTQDGSNTIFTLDFALKSGSEQIFIDSAFLANKDNQDYTLSGTNLEFTFSPQINDFITIFGIKD